MYLEHIFFLKKTCSKYLQIFCRFFEDFFLAGKEWNSLGSITPSGKNSRLMRLTESSLQTQQRLQHQRISQANLVASKEPVQTQQRLQQKRIRQEDLRASEEPIQNEQRLQQQCISQENLRASEGPIKTQQRLQQQRIRQEILRTSELPDYREQRLCVYRSQHVNRRQTSMRQVLYLEAFRYDPTKDYWLHSKAAIGKIFVICK
ncbi:hypothetical protein AVEN_147102-1 [Araneus ventricosus]|uniref:Uncharacterized protein n=1 Tax=Araneus ventricosus TaxID=182803 RepID=A0A4Y2J9K2_ARAVE|nr:hypothetical protein AVEN_147102-1 [Araneus ventricosus]